MPNPSRRKQRLIQPRLQMRLVMSFLGLSVLALALQFLLLAALLMRFAADLPQDGTLLVEELPRLLGWVLGLSLLVCLPLTVSVGVLVTFRIAGPLYRFQKHFEAIARGEDPGECRIRKGDQLQELCAVINSALTRLRANPAHSSHVARERSEAA